MTCEDCNVPMFPIFPEKVAAGKLEEAWVCPRCLDGHIVTVKPIEFVSVTVTRVPGGEP